ncbi:MAG: hypothetical protein ACPIOQ_68715, partial [Promethearchaeia archaeon]
MSQAQTELVTLEHTTLNATGSSVVSGRDGRCKNIVETTRSTNFSSGTCTGSPSFAFDEIECIL